MFYQEGLGIKIKQFIAFNCAPICCFSHVTAVTGQKLQNRMQCTVQCSVQCAVQCTHYFGQCKLHRAHSGKALCNWWRKASLPIYSNCTAALLLLILPIYSMASHAGPVAVHIGIGWGPIYNNAPSPQYSLANYAILKTALSPH